MTSEEKRRFESQWPSVASRLEGMLARRGVPIDRREDIVQETGLRLLKSWEKVDAARPLWPLTVTIALNLMRDQARKGLGSEVPCELPERSDEADVEALGLARLELKRAGIALAQMKPGQRHVLLAELDPVAYPPSASPAATKMLRMRARRKLSVLMQQVSALGLLPMAVVRKISRVGHLVPFSRATEGAVTSALCGVLCVVALGGAVSLAPFSALPGGDDLIRREDPAIRSTGDNFLLSSGTFIGSVAAENGALQRELRGAAGRSGSQHGAEDSSERKRLPDDKGTIEQGGSFEVPVGGKPLIEGSVMLQVFGGGHGGSAPTSFDCSEHMVTPNEIDATCWDQRDPERRYGVRVKHEAKTTLDELKVSGT